MGAQQAKAHKAGRATLLGGASFSVGARVAANEWWLATAIFLLTRLFALAGAYDGATRLARAQPAYNKGWLAEASLMWDAAHYVTIARDHYSFDPLAPAGSNVAFAPLYPALMSMLSQLLRWITFGWDWGNEPYGALIAAGLIISNLSFFVALALLICWLTPRLGRVGAAMTALGLASLPTAFFFSAIYTEGLFLLLVVASLLVAHSDWRHKWAAAGLIGLLAVLTRFTGILLLPVLLVDYMAQTGQQWRKVRTDVLWLGLVPVGVFLYIGFLWWRFGDPFALNKSMLGGWGHQASFFAETYWNSLAQLWNSLTGAVPAAADPVLRYGNGSRLYLILDLTMPVLLLAGGFAARKKLVAAEWTWLALGVLYPLSANITFSMARYVLPLWPGLIWLGTLQKRSRWLGYALVLASLLLMSWCSRKYAGANWVG